MLWGWWADLEGLPTGRGRFRLRVRSSLVPTVVIRVGLVEVADLVDVVLIGLQRQRSVDPTVVPEVQPSAEQRRASVDPEAIDGHVEPELVQFPHALEPLGRVGGVPTDCRSEVHHVVDAVAGREPVVANRTRPDGPPVPPGFR